MTFALSCRPVVLVDWVSFVRNNMQCKSYAHRIYTEQANRKTVMLHLSYLKPVQTRISFMFSASHASSCLVRRRNRWYRWYRVSLLVTLCHVVDYELQFA